MKTVLYGAAMLLLIASACAGDEIWGRVTGVDAEGALMEVSGVTIIARSAVIRDIDGLPAALEKFKRGDFARVRGTFSAPGAMIATEIRKQPIERGRIIGAISAVSDVERTITIGGITIKVPVDARLRDESRSGAAPEGISPGRRAECRGYWTAARDFVAKRITLR